MIKILHEIHHFVDSVIMDVYVMDQKIYVNLVFIVEHGIKIKLLIHVNRVIKIACKI